MNDCESSLIYIVYYHRIMSCFQEAFKQCLHSLDKCENVSLFTNTTAIECVFIFIWRLSRSLSTFYAIVSFLRCLFDNLEPHLIWSYFFSHRSFTLSSSFRWGRDIMLEWSWFASFDSMFSTLISEDSLHVSDQALNSSCEHSRLHGLYSLWFQDGWCLSCSFWEFIVWSVDLPHAISLVDFENLEQ